LITPEYIDQLINFYPGASKDEWQFNVDAMDMRNLQIKGSARIFNLLKQHKIALLADEVGMGKTIQSLAVISALLHEKPNARILILAPRDEIAKNWEKEYQTFVRYHYRHHDNIIKSATGSDPVRKMVYCPNLYYLTHEVQQGWGQIFIGKISSFSSLLARKEVKPWLEDLGIKNLSRIDSLSQKEDINNEVAHLLRSEILNHADEGKPYFDLVVIDEAHYFRRKDGESLRVQSANTFFGDPLNPKVQPIAENVLLLTATPNHSSSKDISNIVSYFTNKFVEKEYKDVLETICVRRLRRLSKESLNKYNYREEIESQSNFENNPLSETFFALYQHELAKKVSQTKGKTGRGVSRMMKYLEGVEFIPFEKNGDKDDSFDKNLTTDFSKGEDAEILLDISKRYYEIFSSNPNHPKYDKLVKDLTTNHAEEKAVVFVRRIPSVYEIAKRVLEHYDRRMWSNLQDEDLAKLKYDKLDRRAFNNVISVDKLEDDEDDLNLPENENPEEEGNIPSSKVFNLFKVIKNGPVVRTSAANFRLRFNSSKPGIYAMFFSPGANYFDLPYSDLISHRFEVGKKQLENYFLSTFKHRSDLIENTIVSKDLQSVLMPRQPIDGEGETRPEKFETLFTIFWDVFLNDEKILEADKHSIKSIYQSFDYYEKEALSSFIEKGTLLASEGLIWMYKIFRALKDDNGPVDHYQKFTLEIKKGLKATRLYYQIQDSIRHFKSIYSKVFGINSNRALLDQSWDSFNNAQPIYPYNADNSNRSVLNSFNTPFFPDILVATSVLQEGVNLQYFCKNIYHYGMSWTPGDNEQRIGRIDRMFGKIERDLNQDKNSTLPIYYPYLKDTIDEEHLAKFVKRKYREESLIDLGKAFKDSADFSLEENNNDNWREYLRAPKENSIEDPFPANKSDFDKVKEVKYKETTISFTKLHHSIINAINELNEYKPKVHFIDQVENSKIIIDPTLRNNRKQPVIIETVFDPIGTGHLGEAIYCLRMKTPLAPITKLKHFRRAFYTDDVIQKSYGPGIKLCMDISQTGGSLWGIYMTAELPFFIKDLNENPLSKQEVQNAFAQLIECADLTEKRIFDNQDLQLESLNLPIRENKELESVQLRISGETNYVPNWKKQGQQYILESEYWIEVFDMEKKSMMENHSNLYVKTFMKKNKWILQTAYLATDAQESEIDILENHHNVVTNNLGW
jgi:superfamily II DNA or RNA helicase